MSYADNYLIDNSPFDHNATIARDQPKTLMSQTDHQLLLQSRPYLYSIVFSAVLAGLALLFGQLLTAGFAFVICALLLLGRSGILDLPEPERIRQRARQFCLSLAIITLAAMALGVRELHLWSFLIPLLILYFYEFKPALWLVGIYSLLLVIIIHLRPARIETIQLIANYIMYLGIGCSLVYLREVRRRQLRPLRRTDNLTTAATREHLDDDLTKEIQRSEREGSDLATMALAIDPICLSKLSRKEQDTVTIHLGKLLHNNLRLFDSYYLWEQHEFLIVLPHTSSAQAVKIANSLRVKIRKEISIKDENITISVGVAGLNVGDDCSTLTRRAALALKDSQNKGSNRTALYRAPDGGDGNGNGNGKPAGDDKDTNS